MPGLSGFTKRNINIANTADVLRKMQDITSYRPFNKKDFVYEDENISATRVFLPVIQKESQPFVNDGVFIWLDGEFYNQDRFTKDQIHDPVLLSYHYKNNQLEQFLKSIDGIFTAVIYDKRSKKVRLLSDRNGLKHLYFAINKGDLIWSSEVKSFPLVPSFSPEINNESVQDFLTNGYLLGNKTWIKGIELLEPATILTFDLTNGNLSTSKYWSWNEIAVKEPADLESLAIELGVRFKNAVVRRCGKGERIGIGLSGGLDSRSIFAALPSRISPVPVVTFGKAGCPDLNIAKRVATLRPTNHHICDINKNNWLDNRCEGIWFTDGQMNMLHMHGIEQIDQIRSWFDIELNGFLGDAFLGGLYLSRNNVSETETFNNRGRRFIAEGLVLSSVFFHVRAPFADNHLMELVMSVPAHLRKNSFIYSRMLLSNFPDYFRNIPWQKTSIPVSYSGFHWDTYRFVRKAVKGLMHRMPFINDPDGYTDYPVWIRSKETQVLFHNILINKNAIINNFIDQSRIVNDFKKHMSGLNRSEILGLYMTFEIWLQQFFNNKFRNGFEP